MAGRWGLGPVFAYEWLTIARRWQVYAGRVLFVGILLIGMTSVWGAQVAGQPALSIRGMAAVGRAFYVAIVFTQLTLLLLAAPAATAGAICLEKARGNLAQLLITDLSDTEVVLGKLAARLVPILGMVCCSLPVLAIGTLLGGIDPLALTGIFLINIGVAVLGGTIAFTFSVWGTRAHEVLLATFSVLAIWLLAFPVWEFFVWLRGMPPLPKWANTAHPLFLAYAPYFRFENVSLWHYFAFLGGCLLLSAVLAGLSIWRMRSVIVGQADRPLENGVRNRFLAFSPNLDENPALWYEWHRKRPTPWVRAMIRVYVGLALGFSLLAIEDCLRPSTPVRGWFPAYVTSFQVALGIPLLLISAATALVEERARGSLDVLLTTPLSSRSIVLAKWWSVFRHVPAILVMPVVVAAVLAGDKGSWKFVAVLVVFLVAAGAAWTSVGIALSTWAKRVGRSVSMAVVLFTFVSLGWPIFAKTLWNGYQRPGEGLSTVSVFYGTFDLTMCIAEPRYFENAVTWCLGWSLANALVAAGLLAATLATFDRSVGRISERVGPRRRARGRVG